jgi:peptide/nickel transport system permease protein
MYAYILRKVLYNIPVYLGIVLLVMICLRVNDPIGAYLGKSGSRAQYESLAQAMGLDRPLLPVSASAPRVFIDSRSLRQVSARQVERAELGSTLAGAEPPVTVTPELKAEAERVLSTLPGVQLLRLGDVSVRVHNPASTQYFAFLGRVLSLDFSERSWSQRTPVGEMLAKAVWPSLAITVPALVLTTLIAVGVALVAAYARGSLTDRVLMFAAVVGMSVSLLVYVVLGQYFGAAWPRRELGLDLFAITGYEPGIQNWAYYCLLPVIITVLLSLGYDARFYRAVMVEECGRDYIVTAMAKGASKPRIMFVHMLKNAMIPIITHVMITLPFLITGSIVMESYFQIPGMGRTLITAIVEKDFPIIQAFTAVFAAVFIATNIATDVLYALVDPRVRLS